MNHTRWKRRLLEVSLAGGILAGVSGCGDDIQHAGCLPPLANQNPDPCCYDLGAKPASTISTATSAARRST